MTSNNYNPVKGFEVKDKAGKIHLAIYTANRLGNMRMNVNGKFYTDKQFCKHFKKI